MATRILTILLIAMIITPLGITISRGQVVEIYSMEPTNVYGAVKLVPRVQGMKATLGAYDEATKTLVIAGTDHVSLIDMKSGRYLWSESLIGTATAIGQDSTSPKWFAVGTNWGEVVAFKQDDPRNRIDYYTSYGVNITQVYVVKDGDEYRVIAVDKMYNAYIFEPGKPYWSHIGRERRDNSLTWLDNTAVLWVAPLKVYTGVNEFYYKADTIILNAGLIGEFTGTVKALIYYNDTEDLRIKPAIPGRTPGDLIDERNLTYILLYNNAILSQGDAGGAGLGNEIKLEGLYSTLDYELVIIYSRKLIDNNTNITVYSECYSASVNFSLTPGEVLDLGKIIAEPTARTFEECIGNYGIDLENKVSINPLLVLNTLRAPEKLELGKDAIFKVAPSPAKFTQKFIFDFAAPYQKPEGWPRGAEYLLVVASNDQESVYIYMFDKNMDMVRIGGSSNNQYVNIVHLENATTSVLVGSRGDRIYIGTLSGRILMLEWDKDRGEYIGKRAIHVGKGPIIGIREVDPNYIIAVAADGSMQLVKIDEWLPMWRGAPTYYSMNLGEDSTYLIHADKESIYAVTASGSVIRFAHNMNEYQPIIMNINVSIETLDGGTSSYTGPIYVYSRASGEEVLRVKAVKGRAVVYTPLYPVDLSVELPGIGSATIHNIESRFPYTEKNISIKLREVELFIYTPEGVGDPLKDPGYKLVSGPQGGVQITLTGSSQDPTLPYTINPYTIKASTGPDGRAKVLLFEGESYTGVAGKPRYMDSQFTITGRGAVRVEVQLHPILYKVPLEVLDGDAYARQVIYGVNNTSLTIVSKETQRSVSIRVDWAQIVYLPEDSYVITASNPNYIENSTEANIPGTGEVLVLLAPKHYTATLVPLIDDNVLNIKDLFLSMASIKVKMIEPYETGEALVEPGGQVVLRYGLYMVSVEDEIAGYTKTVWISGDGVYYLRGKPYYSMVGLDLKDKEVKEYKLYNLRLNITYTYNEYTITRTLDVSGDRLMLPYGNYTIIVQKTGYKDLTVRVNLNITLYNLTGYLEPLLIEVSIGVFYNDPVSGLASGGVPSVDVEMILTEPNVPGIKYMLHTNDVGYITGVLREGVYKVRITGGIIQESQYTLNISRYSTMEYILYVAPRYAELEITVIDAEVPVQIPGANVVIERLGPGDAKSFTITSETGRERLILPMGDYIVSASIPSRYEPLPVTIPLSQNTSVVVKMNPVKVSVEVVAVTESSYAVYNNVKYPLPRGIVPEALIRLVPLDPLLTIVGVKPIQVATSSNGTQVVADVRPGTYLVIAIKEGYDSIPVAKVIVTDGARVEAPLIPRLHAWNFTLKDVEVVEELSLIEEGSLNILSYNRIPVNLSIPYKSGDRIMLPTGVYNISGSSAEHYGKPVVIEVAGDGSAILPLLGKKLSLHVKLTADLDGEEVPVLFGSIVALAIDQPLKDRLIEFNVSRGEAVLELRRGTYDLVYTIPGTTQVWELDRINVTREEALEYKIKVDRGPVTIKLLDSEYDVMIQEALVTIKYNGPFSTSEEVLEYKLGIKDTIPLPPGRATIHVTAYGYDEAEIDVPVEPGQDLTIYLDPIKVPILISFTNQDGEPVKESLYIVLRHTELPLEINGTTTKSSIYLEDVRLGNYTLTVIPTLPNSLYDVTKTSITVSMEGVSNPVVEVKYKLFNVTILMIDKEYNKPIDVEYELSINRKGGASEALGFPLTIKVKGEANLTLPPGDYTITINPVKLDPFTPPSQITFTVPTSTVVRIEMQPKQYTATLLVVDDRGDPLDNVLVTLQIEGRTVAAGYTDANGEFTAPLRYGIYTVQLEKPGYKSTTATLQIPLETGKTLKMMPEPITRIKRMAPIIVGVAGIIILGSTLYVMRERLARRILEEEEYF